MSAAIPFWKMEGCGNDYLYVDLAALDAELAQWITANAADLARDMSDRHFGVGADGLVLLAPDPSADARMIMYNADGSRGATCGNALRCIALHLGRDTVAIATDAGAVRARVDGAIAEVDMGAPSFDAAAIPFVPEHAELLGGGADSDGPDAPWRIRVGVEGEPCVGYALSMGNPHCVVLVDRDPSELDLPAVARPLQDAPFFPDSCNVELVHASRDLLLQRTYERGSGETLACGSGACAVAVAAVHAGLRVRDTLIEIRLAGGVLQASCKSDGSVLMRGPGRRVFEGVYRPATAGGAGTAAGPGV